jgi:Fuc2NAc and GlcNAc transferase
VRALRNVSITGGLNSPERFRRIMENMRSISAWFAVTAGILSIALTGIVRRYAASRRILDIPNSRSSHDVPTPRGGGLAIVLSFSATLAVLAVGGEIDRNSAAILLICGGIVGVVGLLDDKYQLPARVRFAAQLLAACLFVALADGLSAPMIASFSQHQWIGGLTLVVLLIWATNLFNFMDGLDGIAASEAAFVAGAGGWLNFVQDGSSGVTTAMFCLCTISLGFLVWNWPPAKIFLGDVGSGFLGLMLAMLGLLASSSASTPVQVWVILGGAFVVDATVTLMRRMVRGDRWLEGHRLHAYQHLARRWNGHLPVTLLFTAINLLWLFPWALYAQIVPGHATMIMLTALVPLVALALFAGAGKLE